MKQLIAEFKDFINKGDVVVIAVGLVMALYFKTIVDQIVAGVITPLVSAVFQQEHISEIDFYVGDAQVSIGLVIKAVIDFLIVSMILFLVIKAYNRWKAKEEEAQEDPGPTEVELLADIRDALRNR